MNKNISNIQIDILDNQRRELLTSLIPFTRDFVLGGGTALALQLAHRKSFDFDFFSLEPISKKLLEKLSQNLSIGNIVIDNADELTFFTKEDIKISFLYYPFGPYFEVLKTKDKLRIFSVQEIALQKTYAIGRRGEYRDYFDLYTILKNEYINLNKLISLSKKVYPGLFDEKLFLEQLVYFGDITNFDVIPASGEALPKPETVKEYFERLVEKLI